MKKALQVLGFVLLGLTFVQVNANAQTIQDFTVQAEIPASGVATFAVSQVDAVTQDFVSVATTDLNFGVLALDTNLGIFLPAFFWVVDVGADGAGQPDVDFSYTDTAIPVGQGALNSGNGLGGRGTISYQEVVTNPDATQTVNLIRGEALQDATASAEIDETQFANGFLRFSVGIATGDPALQEGTATPFTGNDQPGNYAGTLTVTATFD